MADANIWGAVAQGVGQLVSNRQQAVFAHQAQGRQQSFQDYMSSTAYQRAVLDMKRAGLNPMLAYQHGGASTPSGGGQSAGPMGNPGEAFMRGGLTAAQTKVTSAQVAKTEAETENVKADTLGKLEIPELLRAQTLSQNASAEQLRESARKLREEIARILPAQEKHIYAQRDLDLSKLNLNTFERLAIQPLLRDLHTIERAIGLLSMPRHVAEAGAWRTGYGANIRPYLGDLSTLINSAAAGIGGAAGLKYLIGGPGRNTAEMGGRGTGLIVPESQSRGGVNYQRRR